MRLVLVQPGRMHMTEKIIDPSTKPWLPPSSLLMVAGMTPDKLNDESIILQIWDETTSDGPLDFNEANPDIVALTGLTTSRLRMYEIATQCHQRNIPIIAGGMDVSGHFVDGFDKELLSFYDAIVVGKLNQKLWQKVLGDCKSHRLDQVYQTDPAEPTEFAPLRYDLIDPAKYRFLSLSTSHGCPFKCPWCGVDLIWDRVTYKPQEILKQDIKNLPAGLLRKHYPVALYDDTFALNPEETAKNLPLLKAMGRPWFCETTAKILLNLIPQLAEHGCWGAYFGGESIYGDIGIKSVRSSDLVKIVDTLHEYKMMSLISFVFGGVNESGEFFEDQDVFVKTSQFANNIHSDSLQFSLVFPIPGTRFRQKMIAQDRIIDFNPEHGDGAWPTVDHPYITPENAFEGLKLAYELTYGKEGISTRLSHVSKTFPWWKGKLIMMANNQVRRSAQKWWGKANFTTWEATRLETQKAYDQYIETLFK